MYTDRDILNMAEEEDVEFIRLQFTDIFGELKNTAITVNRLEKALKGECRFDGSSIEGFARVEESEMYLKPDMESYVTFPWRPQQGKVARLLCDIYNVDGKPYEGDCRYVLKKAILEAKKLGLEFKIGPELEFFLFNLDEEGQPTTYSPEKAGYFDVGPADYGENARRDMVLTLEDMGFEVLGSHHEVAPAQHQIDFQHDDALKTADNIMTYKMAVKIIAKRHGLHATFMPKPKAGMVGSGMHINVSAFKDGRNIFADTDDENGLSREGYYFIAGIMKHINALTAITNPLVNSYKRLVPGFEAPVHVAWSTQNRSPLIRVPYTRDNDRRIELRFPDPSANPYLALAAIITAGLDGIKNQLEPVAREDRNLFAMSDEELAAANIKSLPECLGDAIAEFEKDELFREAFGDFIFEKYVQAKKEEFKEYREYVSQWEINRYLAKN